jgi:hypothetical protein
MQLDTFENPNPAYGGCTCDCHKNSGMMHIVPCCYLPVQEKCPDCGGLGGEIFLMGEDENGNPVYDCIECNTCEGSGKVC